MLEKIGTKRAFVAAAFVVGLLMLWSYGWYTARRLSPQEQLLVGNWSHVGPPPRMIVFRADRSFSNTIVTDGITHSGGWFIRGNTLYLLNDSDSWFDWNDKEPFPIYSLDAKTLQLGDKQSLIASLTRMPPEEIGPSVAPGEN